MIFHNDLLIIGSQVKKKVGYLYMYTHTHTHTVFISHLLKEASLTILSEIPFFLSH